MNYQISKTPFQDLLFVRLKAENSIRLPQAPSKNHLFSSESKVFNQGSLVNSMLNLSQGSFIQKIIKQKNKPSKEEVIEWINKKQIQIKSIISKKKKLSQLKIISDSDKIVLKPKEHLKQKNCDSTAKIQKQIIRQSSSQESNRSNSPKQRFSIQRNFSKNDRLSQIKLENRKRSIIFEQISQPNQKINDKLQKTHLSKCRKIANRILQKSNFMQSCLSQRTNLDNLKSSIFQSQVCSHQNYKKGNILSKEKRRRYSTAIISRPKEIQANQRPNKGIRQNKKILTEETAKKPQKNTLNSGQRLSPLKKYTQRELSPNDKKDLVGKYSQLQNRLDKLLKGSENQKKRNN